MVNSIEVEVEYFPEAGAWTFIILRAGIKAWSKGYPDKRMAKRAANEIIRDLRKRNVIHVNKTPGRVLK